MRAGSSAVRWGSYFDEAENKDTGIAEYESRERLAEIQRKCEAEPAYADIQSRGQKIATSFEESILDKLEIDP